MDDIKFRAWDIVGEEMFIPKTITWGADMTNGTVSKTQGRRFFFNEVKLMLYSGIKDNNNVEICESDIVALKFIECGNGHKLCCNAKIRFDKGCLEVYGHNVKNTLYCMSLKEIEMSDYYVEVIGNIYDNPGLLI